jgi:uncharacterized protein
MKSIIRAAWLALLFTATIVNAQKLPEKPNPPRLVNDYVNLLSEAERNQLERKLVRFDDSTSTQIAIVITDDLQGLEPQEYATQLGNKWGVGQKGKNNGVLILVSPKLHKLFTASGYGAEGALPDLRIQDIEDAVMFPNFKQGNFYAGLDKGTSLMISSLKGEYKADPNARKKGRGKNDVGAVFIFLIIGFFLLISILGRMFGKRGGSHIASKGVPWWMWLFLLNSGGSRGSSWNDFNSGGGGFGGGGGGGGGGFGGFGGGSFGGGGAGGSW